MPTPTPEAWLLLTVVAVVCVVSAAFELAPGWHPAAERRARNLLRRTRAASNLPPAPRREPGLVEEVTAS